LGQSCVASKRFILVESISGVLRATILVDVKKGMPAYDEELFGARRGP